MNINNLISMFENRTSMEGILKQSCQSLEEYIIRICFKLTNKYLNKY